MAESVDIPAIPMSWSGQAAAAISSTAVVLHCPNPSATCSGDDGWPTMPNFDDIVDEIGGVLEDEETSSINLDVQLAEQDEDQFSSIQFCVKFEALDAELWPILNTKTLSSAYHGIKKNVKQNKSPGKTLKTQGKASKSQGQASKCRKHMQTSYYACVHENVILSYILVCRYVQMCARFHISGH